MPSTIPSQTTLVPPLPSPSTPRSYTIRTRTPHDAPALVALLSAVHVASGYPVEGPEASTLRPPDILHALVAVAGPTEVVVGHVLLTGPSASAVGSQAMARLGRLMVLPGARGGGVGGALVREAVAWAEGRGLRVGLMVLDKDGDAGRLYERLGWSRGAVVRYCVRGRVWMGREYVWPIVRYEEHDKRQVVDGEAATQ